MIKFVGKLFLFLLPVPLLYLFPLYAYWQGREYASIPEVVAAQARSPQALYGPAYSFAERSYKQALVAARNPTIIALGTSRVLGFHSRFFIAPEQFINAGNGVKNIDDLTGFVKALPAQNRVSVIILGLDPWWFKPGQEYPLTPEQLTLGEKLKAFFARGWRTVYGDYAQGKFTLAGLTEASHATSGIGLGALIHQNGFLNDGSHLYGDLLQNPSRVSVLHGIVDAEALIMRNDRSTLEYGTTTSSAALMSLQQFLALCKARHVHVVGFIPPYQQSMYDALVDPNDAYTTEARVLLPNQLKDMFAAYDFNFFDYTDPRSVGITENEFVDNQHSTDKASLRMLVAMAQHDEALQKYVYLPSLEKLLAQTSGDAIMTKLP